ncbi:MAG: hypothetical protein ACRDQ1_16715 [Sciscionella sp.]
MTYLAAALVRHEDRWQGTDMSLDGCESVAGEPRAFLSDGRAAQAHPMAALLASDLEPVGGSSAIEPDEDDLAEASPVVPDGPFGAPEIVDDLGTSAAELLRLCAQERALPTDLLVSVCERAGCGKLFDELRA